MKKKKLFLMLLAVIVPISMMSQRSDFSVRSHLHNIPLRTHTNHPDIPGFTYRSGFASSRLRYQNTTGYFYYDTDLYSCPFSTTSTLYLIHVQGEFVAGSLANKNNDYYWENGNQVGYDKNYDIDSGYIHILPKRKVDGNVKTSSFVYKGSWPDTTPQEYSVTTSFSGSVSVSSQIETGASFSQGASVSAKDSVGFTLTSSSTTTIYGSEPQINKVTSSSDLLQQNWSYQYQGYGKSLCLDTFYLLEVKKDGSGYATESFTYDVEITMNTVAWRGYWWQQNHSVTMKRTETFGN